MPPEFALSVVFAPQQKGEPRYLVGVVPNKHVGNQQGSVRLTDLEDMHL